MQRAEPRRRVSLQTVLIGVAVGAGVVAAVMAHMVQQLQIEQLRAQIRGLQLGQLAIQQREAWFEPPGGILKQAREMQAQGMDCHVYQATNFRDDGTVSPHYSLGCNGLRGVPPGLEHYFRGPPNPTLPGLR